MKSGKPVTMRHVAQAAGVAVSTVSKALRNDPSIPAKRCRAIQAAARRLGYQPHPLVATLMSQLHHHRRRSDPHSLAWIDLWSAADERESALNAKPILDGARERAREMGYGIEVYAAGADRMSPEHLRRVLSVRGQWGLIIPPVPESAAKFALDLRGLAAVTIGTSLHEPVMHRVAPNHFQGGVLAFQRLREKGAGRIGLLLSPAMNERVEGKWLGAFLACQQHLPSANRVAPLIAGRQDHAALARWLRQERPDAVLAAEVFSWKSAGLPGRMTVGWLLPGERRGSGCLDHRPRQLGRVAVEMVVAQIHRNECGSPAHPQTVLIDPAWVDS